MSGCARAEKGRVSCSAELAQSCRKVVGNHTERRALCHFSFPRVSSSASVKGSVFRGVMTLSQRCNAHRLLCASSVCRHTGPRGLQLSLFLPEAPQAPRLPPCFDSRSHADPVYVNEIRHKLDQQQQRHIASV